MTWAREIERAKENLAAENYSRARRICERVLRAEPDSPEALAILGTAEMKHLRFREAAPMLARSVDLQPGQPEVWDKLGYCYLRLRRPDQALAAYREALKAPQPPFEALAGAAHILTGRGDMDQAVPLLKQAAEQYPLNLEGWRMLAALTDFKTDRDLLPALEDLRAKTSALAPADRAHLHYALAIAYEALGRTEQFHAEVEAANALQRTIVVPWREAVDLLTDMSEKVFTPGLLAKRTSTTAKKLTPIFVVSPPRSGSTLVEQILASHPDVFGADEVPLVRSLVVDSWPALTGVPYPMKLDTLPEDALDDLARKYQERVAEISGERAFVCDKNVENILYVGIIRMIMPWAKVIHIRRHPADTALSIYKRYLLPSVGYACDLRDIASYLKTTDRLMGHWQKIAPGFVHSVKYEDLVANPEATVKGMLAFCGLDWDARVLDFHKAERVVYTQSAQQVRKPLSPGAIGRWKKHSRMLQPFLTDAAGLIDAYGD